MDYDAIALEFGGVSAAGPEPTDSIDYDALASEFGGVSAPAATPTPATTMTGQPTPTPTPVGVPTEPEQNSFYERSAKFMKDAPGDVLSWVQDLPMAVREMVTGEAQMTDEIKDLPNWSQIPELQKMDWANVKATFGTAMADYDEKKKVIENLFPDIKFAKDTKGNWIMTSAIDGKKYGFIPGLDMGDIQDIVIGVAGGAIAAKVAPFIGGLFGGGTAATIGGAAAAEGVIQAGHETMQAVTGGEFNVAPIAMATALGGGMKAGGALVDAVKGRGVSLPTDAAIPKQTPVQAPIAPRPEAEELSQIAFQATAEGGKKKVKEEAAKEFAAEIDLDPILLEAADDLGVRHLLDPAHMSTNKQYIDLDRLAKKPGSKLLKNEVEKGKALYQKSKELIDEFGGTDSIDDLSVELRGKMDTHLEALKASEDKAWIPMNKISGGYKVNASNTLELIEKEGLSREKGVTSLIKDYKDVHEKIKGKPTYDDLKDLKDEVQDAVEVAKREGRKTKITKLQNLSMALREDQKNVAIEHGIGDQFEHIMSASKTRFGYEDQMRVLFGKKFKEETKSITRELRAAVREVGLKQAPSADKLLKLIKATPKSERQRLVTSAVGMQLNKKGEGFLSVTEYKDWFNNMNRNKTTRNAIATNLPPGAWQKLESLSKISEGVSRSIGSVAPTGIRNQVAIDKSEKILSNFALKSVVMGGAAAADTAITGGAGSLTAMAIMRNVLSGKKLAPKDLNIAESLNKLMTDPVFLDALEDSIAGGIQKEKKIAALSRLQSFKKFASLVDVPKMARSKWLEKAMEYGRVGVGAAKAELINTTEDQE